MGSQIINDLTPHMIAVNNHYESNRRGLIEGKCSVCGKHFVQIWDKTDEHPGFKYCPHCGLKFE